jgi:broad specificity phosphatase PhoE
MRKITFIRHAKVDMDSSIPMTSKMLKRWEEAYNNAPIIQDLPEDQALYQVFDEVDYILSSTLKRSHDSVALLDRSIDESNVLFNEAQVPALEGTFIKLKPTSWLVLFRLFSLVGFGRWAMTLKETKSQAKEASEILLKLSEKHDNIILLGHGVMNWLITKELGTVGWESKGKSEHHNWGITSLTRST